MLAGLGLGRAAGRLRARGRILLDRVPAAPAGLVSAAGFPLIDALHGRRSRRFGLGCSIPEGPLAHASRHDPVPLSDLEQLLVLTATAGNTGWHHLIPHNPAYLPHIPNYAGSAGGRTFPSGGGIHTTEFFYTDDSGTYFFPTRDAPALAGYGADGSIVTHHNAFREQVKALAARHPDWFPDVPYVPGMPGTSDIVGGQGGMMRMTPFGGDKARVTKACRTCFDEGVIVFYCGHGPFHLRMLPPLGVMKLEDWPRVFERVERGLAKAAG